MSTHTKNLALLAVFLQRGIAINLPDVETLRRAQLTLHRWGEHMCNGDIERDEDSGIAYFHYGRRTNGPFLTVKTADREAGALKRIADVCKRNGLHYFHQSDPRGCALYVSAEPLTYSDYNHGIACCI